MGGVMHTEHTEALFVEMDKLARRVADIKHELSALRGKMMLDDRAKIAGAIETFTWARNEIDRMIVRLIIAAE
jgi:hypothetical protein